MNGSGATDERLLGVGVDGAPGGWVAVACWGARIDVNPEQRRSQPMFVADIRTLSDWRADQPGGAAAAVAVDMPIGLPPVVGYRACDEAARARLPGPQKPSVFQAPSRRLLVCATEPDAGKPPKAKVVFERARELVREEQRRLDEQTPATGGSPGVLRMLTQQAAGILARVAEVDAFMREQPPDAERAREAWLVEVHPEMSFRAMGGGVMPSPKSSAHGQLDRLDLVRREFPDAEERIREWPLGARYSLLDICDAYAACWTALRWAATAAGAISRRREVTPPLEVLGEVSPGEPDREAATDLAMRMVV